MKTFLKNLRASFPIRRLSRGVEIWYVHRILFTPNWRNKPRPYWFTAKYNEGTRTIQCMWVEYWYRPHMRKSS